MRIEHATSIALTSAGGAMLALGYIALRQIGAVRHLPDPPGEMWGSNAIVMSKAAHPFGIPDGMLGLGSYALTAGLIVARSRLIRVKLACDAGTAGFNVVRQVVEFRKICSWCMVAAGFAVPMVWFGWKASGRQ